MEFYTIPANKELDKYDAAILSAFMSKYKFDSYDDYKEMMDLLKDTPYFDSTVTCYTKFSSTIAKKSFDSESIDREWIIRHMATLDGSFKEMAGFGTFSEINDFMYLIFSREKGKEVEILNKLIDEIDGFNSESTIYNAIIRYCLTLSKKVKNVELIISNILNKDRNIDIKSLETRFAALSDVKTRNVIGKYLYKKTKDLKYIPTEIKDLFF